MVVALVPFWFFLQSCVDKKGFHILYRYVAEWIELWDLEAVTSYNREMGVCGPIGASRLKIFHPWFTPTVFLHSSRKGPSGSNMLKSINSSKF